MKVECTNCGGVGPSFWVTLGALAIAATALFFNYRQYREFSRRLRARARFRVTLRVVGSDENGIRWTDGDKCFTRVGIGIKNEGDLAAGPTLINALFPRHIEIARWSGPGGEERDEDGVIANAGDDDVIIDPDGTEFLAKYLSKTIPRIGTKPYHEAFFQFPVDVSFSGEATIPVRIKVQADEIPDDIEEYEETLMVRVARRPRPAIRPPSPGQLILPPEPPVA